MTFCLGMKIHDGLIGIADTRVTSGTEYITARKVTIYEKQRHPMFLMTSGLRAARDKALTYFEEVIAERPQPFDRLYKAVNAFAEQIRRVAQEDRAALTESGLQFDIRCLAGGQLEKDPEHKLYLLYPEGNWVEIGQGTPYHIMGESGYGKPILVRTLKYQDSMRHALKVGYLAFDSTRISAADVDFPIDVVLYARDSYRILEHRYDKDDFKDISNWWQEQLRQSVHELPSQWMDRIFSELPLPSPGKRPDTS
ncbi:MAG: peptidase [Planctomycetes bacterium]|nr:peptidase [Planctomycetota bacterium]